MPWILYPQRKSHQYLLDWRLDGSQSQSECSGEEKEPIFALLGVEPQLFSL